MVVSVLGSRGSDLSLLLLLNGSINRSSRNRNIIRDYLRLDLNDIRSTVVQIPFHQPNCNSGQCTSIHYTKGKFVFFRREEDENY